MTNVLSETFDTLLSDIKVLSQEFTKQHDEVDTLQKEISTLEHTVTLLNGDVDTVTQEKETLQQQYNDLHALLQSERQSFKQRDFELQERLVDYDIRCESLQRETDALRSQTKQQDDLVNSLQGQVSQGLESSNKTRAELECTNTRLLEVKTALEKLQNENNNLHDESAYLTSANTLLEAEVHTLRSKVSDLQQDEDTDVSALKQQLQTSQAKSAALEHELEVCTGKLALVDAKCKSLRKEKELLEKDIAEKNKFVESHKRKYFFFM